MDEISPDLLGQLVSKTPGGAGLKTIEALATSAGKAIDSTANGSRYQGSKSETTVRANTPGELQESLGEVRKRRDEVQQSFQGIDKKVSELHGQAATAQEAGAENLNLRTYDSLGNIQDARGRTDTLLMDTYKQLQAAKQEAVVDPDRIFREPGRDGKPGDISLSKKTMSAIAVALGAMGASLGGGQNYAMEIVQSAIERDINAQKDAYQQKMKNIMLQRQVALDEKSLADLDVITSEIARVNILSGVQAQLGALSSRESSLLTTPTFKQMQLNVDAGWNDALSRTMEGWKGLSRSDDAVSMNALGDLLAGSGLYRSGGEGYLSTRDRVLSPRETWTGGPQSFGSDWRSP